MAVRFVASPTVEYMDTQVFGPNVVRLPLPHSSQLRVMVVTESFLPQINGVTNSVRRVLEHLDSENHIARVLAPTGPESYAGFPVVKVRGAQLPFIKDFRVGLETQRRLRAAMLRFAPDVVHIASPASLGYQALHAARDLDIPTVAIYQTDLVGFADRYGIPGAPGAMARLTRRIHKDADLTLAPSSASIAQLHDLGIHNVARWGRGVDLELFSPTKASDALRQRLAPNGELLVGYIGRLAPEKELELLAHIEGMPGVRIVVVGEGPEEGRLRKLLPTAAFLGLLHGEELAAAYATLDVFVHTGRHETFCQAAQEALASGVPVVAPRSGGPIDVVDEGAGFLYAAGVAEDMTRYVQTLVEQPILRHRMALQARRSVSTRSWYGVNSLLVDYYREAIAMRSGLGSLDERVG